MHTTHFSDCAGEGSLYRDPLDRDPPGQRPPWTETPLDKDPHPGRNMGPGTENLLRRNIGPSSQTESDIIQRPSPDVDRQTPVEILPCPKLYLRALKLFSKDLIANK